MLEPSAGTGSLAIWPRSIGAQIMVTVFADSPGAQRSVPKAGVKSVRP